jgi:predicted acyltransferase (DUF342 family)
VSSPGDPLDELPIPDGTTVEEHDIVTDSDVLIGSNSRIEFGIRSRTIAAGERVELGEMTCLNVDGKTFMAQCQMSLNVPMWRKITDGCLSSSLPQSSQPTLHAGLVDAHI